MESHNKDIAINLKQLEDATFKAIRLQFNQTQNQKKVIQQQGKPGF